MRQLRREEDDRAEGERTRDCGDAAGDAAQREPIAPRRRRQRLREIHHGREPLARLERQSLFHGGRNRGRYVRAELPHRHRRTLEPPGDGRARRGAGERRLARQHLVHHAAEAVDVASPIDRGVAARLLGAHVRRRPDCGERLTAALLGRGAVSGRAGHGQAHPEVGDDRVPRLEQDVLGLDVAVHDPLGVRVGERARHLPRDAERLLDGEPSGAREPLSQRLAVDVRHHVEERAVHRARVIERQNVRVAEDRRELNLAQEADRAECGAHLRPEHLDDDGSRVLAIRSAVHDRRAATPELLLQTDAPLGEAGPETRWRRGHGRLGGAAHGCFTGRPCEDRPRPAHGPSPPCQVARSHVHTGAR